MCWPCLRKKRTETRNDPPRHPKSSTNAVSIKSHLDQAITTQHVTPKQGGQGHGEELWGDKSKKVILKPAGPRVAPKLPPKYPTKKEEHQYEQLQPGGSAQHQPADVDSHDGRLGKSSLVRDYEARDGRNADSVYAREVAQREVSEPKQKGLSKRRIVDTVEPFQPNLRRKKPIQQEEPGIHPKELRKLATSGPLGKKSASKEETFFERVPFHEEESTNPVLTFGPSKIRPRASSRPQKYVESMKLIHDISSRPSLKLNDRGQPQVSEAELDHEFRSVGMSHEEENLSKGTLDSRSRSKQNRKHRMHSHSHHSGEPGKQDMFTVPGKSQKSIGISVTTKRIRGFRTLDYPKLLKGASRPTLDSSPRNMRGNPDVEVERTSNIVNKNQFLGLDSAKLKRPYQGHGSIGSNRSILMFENDDFQQLDAGNVSGFDFLIERGSSPDLNPEGTRGGEQNRSRNVSIDDAVNRSRAMTNTSPKEKAQQGRHGIIHPMPIPIDNTDTPKQVLTGKQAADKPPSRFVSMAEATKACSAKNIGSALGGHLFPADRPAPSPREQNDYAEGDPPTVTRRSGLRRTLTTGTKRNRSHLSFNAMEELPEPRENKDMNTTYIQINETVAAKKQKDMGLVAQGRRTKINQYVFINTLGKGAWGEVFLCLDTNTKERVAIKVIDRNLLETKVNIQMVDKLLKAEISILKMLDHPRIIKLFEALEDESSRKIYLVFEYCASGPIGSEMFWKARTNSPNEVLSSLAAKKLKLPEVKDYFAQIAQGVHYLHTKVNIVHSDLKPDNILITKDNQVKITDFGVSLKLGGSSDLIHHDVLGTKMYLPPEHWKKDLIYGRGIDIWALGITIYMLIFDKHPFAEVSIRNEKDLQKALVEKIVEFPSLETGESLEPAGQELLLRMLDKDSKTRIRIDEVLDHPFLKGYIRELVLKPDTSHKPQSTTSLGQVLQVHHRDQDMHRSGSITPINIGDLASSTEEGFGSFAQKAQKVLKKQTEEKEGQSPHNDSVISGLAGSKTSISPQLSPGKTTRLRRMFLDSIPSTKQLTSKVVSKQTVQLKVFKNGDTDQ